MAQVKVFSTASCPICDKTKTLLKKWNIPYEESRVDLSTVDLKEMLKVSDHARTVPQIMVRGQWIGGFSELTELHMDGKLDDLVGS